MSGGIFHPAAFDGVEGFKRNPLLCYLCNEHYENPCLLQCYHSFCSKCLSGRALEGKMTCPLCYTTTPLKDGSSLPPSDPLLKFLVESSSEEKAQCANCDMFSTEMFFCNTCSQPLCSECRDETHKAKMFTKHEIVMLAKRTKDVHKMCALHKEPYIMFSTANKTMLCINCFRDMNIESRAHCVDLETAYSQSCKKLDHAVQAIRELQSSVQDGILLLRVLLDEIKSNSEREKDAIKSLYTLMEQKIEETKEGLLQEADRQYQEKQTVFKEQLTSLNTLLPTLHVNLVTCTAFSSSANKYEFLDLAYRLMSRLTAIAHLQHPISPMQSSMINTDYKAEFARCLEPLLCFKPLRESPRVSMISMNGTNGGSVRVEIPASTAVSSVPVSSQAKYSFSYGGCPQGIRRGNMHSKNVKKMLDKTGVFAEYYKDFEGKYQEITQKFDKLKIQVQEMQRDMTLRRCLNRNTKLGDILSDCDNVGQLLDDQLETNETRRPILEKHWEETVQRVATEQEIYQAQVNEIIKLKQENQHLVTIAKQLEPFLKSITEVTERISPKLGETYQKNKMSELFERISTMQPDSQQRVDAIRITQEERQTQFANRTNPMDDALIKTKGLLKAPTSRRDSSAPRLDLKDSVDYEETVDQFNEAHNLEFSDGHDVQFETEQVEPNARFEKHVEFSLSSDFRNGDKPFSGEKPITDSEKLSIIITEESDAAKMDYAQISCAKVSMDSKLLTNSPKTKRNPFPWKDNDNDVIWDEIAGSKLSSSPKSKFRQNDNEVEDILNGAYIDSKPVSPKSKRVVFALDDDKKGDSDDDCAKNKDSEADISVTASITISSDNGDSGGTILSIENASENPALSCGSHVRMSPFKEMDMKQNSLEKTEKEWSSTKRRSRRGQQRHVEKDDW